MNLSTLQFKESILWLVKSLSLILGSIILPNLYAQAASCPEGYTSASFTANDYTQFGNISGGTTSPSRSVMGGTNNLTASITSNGNSQSIQGSPDTGTGFQINQIMPNGGAVNTTTFRFDKPIDGLKVNIFDIDRVHVGASFGDKVTITAKTPLGATINPTTLTYNGSYYTIDANTIETGTSSAFYQTDNCSGTAATTSNGCLGIATFNQPIKEININFVDNKNERNQQNIIAQFQGLTDTSMCVEKPKVTVEKSDNTDIVDYDSITTYTIKVKNVSSNSVSDVTLSDPKVMGLGKLSNLICDESVVNNACKNTSLPSVAQLESGFTLPTLASNQVYALKVPTRVTSSGGSVTNKANAIYSSISLPITATDTNKVNQYFDPGNDFSSSNTCPAGHKRFEIRSTGSSPPSLTNWVNGEKNRDFIFPSSLGPIKFSISFTNVLDARDSSPYYGSDNNGITDALYFKHASTKNIINHVLNINIDKPVSKAGFTIQDLDSELSNKGPSYQEQVDVSETNGKLTYNDFFHTINSQNNIVTAQLSASSTNNDKSCRLNKTCDIYASWGYKPANTVMKLVHKNLAQRDSTANHELGYKDFYFCLAPPKVVIKKVLDGKRVENDDEFKFEIKEVANTVGSFITESVNGEFVQGKDRSQAISLTPNQTYTISESIVDSSKTVKAGAIDNYKTSYTCTNTVNNTVITNGNNNSFTLPALNFGDEVICTVTNTPNIYTFSGIVFNDNGGITAVTGAEQNADAPYSTTSEYFDGIFQPSKETGIYETGLKINLTDCQGNTLDNKIVAVTDNGPNIGQYSITLAKSKMVNAQGQPLNQVCLVELEPDGNLEGYPVDTTKNKLTIPLVANKFEYSNNNFGEVSQANSALVLQKRQYIAQCNSLPDNLSEIPQADDELPTIAFSTKDPQARVPPGHCIVYKITAINRGHVPLTAITIRDALQKQLPNGTGVTAYYQTSPATISPNGLSSVDGAITESGQNGTIVTNPFALAAGQSKSLLFNTKFGLIND